MEIKSEPNLLLNSSTKTDRVFDDWVEAKIKAKKNSFQAIIKAKIDVAAIPGARCV